MLRKKETDLQYQENQVKRVLRTADNVSSRHSLFNHQILVDLFYCSKDA